MTWLSDSVQQQIAFTAGSGSTAHNRANIKKRHNSQMRFGGWGKVLSGKPTSLILKKSSPYFGKPPQARNAFIKEHVTDFTTRFLCQPFNLHPIGYWAWIRKPKPPRQSRDNMHSELFKQAWVESDCIYGYRKIMEIFKIMENNARLTAFTNWSGSIASGLK